MITSLVAQNIAIWWAQVIVLTAAAASFAWLLKLPAGRGKLLYWQAVAMLTVLLPVLSTWRHDVVDSSITITTSTATVATTGTVAHTMQIPWLSLAFGILALGICVRLVLLMVGTLKLRAFRQASVSLQPPSSWHVEADIRITAGIRSPVTFGAMRPVILLPSSFTTLDQPTQDAILCHEVVHVRRHDWLFTITEELLRSLLWFQPAVWWTLNEIQLAREQAVDAEVIAMLHAKDHYVDALLQVAGAGLNLAPAPSFLRKRHLKQRLFSILQEVPMNERRRRSTFAAGFTLLAASCWFITTAVPLDAAPQADSEGVSVNTNGSTLMHRPPVSYPRDLAARGISGTVLVQVKLDASGEVADASVLSGPDELRRSALQSVLEWHFLSSGGPATRQVAITFEAAKQQTQSASVAEALRVRQSMTVSAPPPPMPPPPPVNRTVTAVQVQGIPEEAQRELLSRIPVHVGDRYDPETLAKVRKIATEFDEHLLVMAASGPSMQDLTIILRAPGFTMPPNPGAFPNSVRVGAAVQQANLIQQVRPVYPPLAKTARVQGTVSLAAVIGRDGSIQNLSVISGPALLVAAAMDAAKQWLYKPTLLNGNPVEVQTTIDINFTLSDGPLPAPAN